MKRVFPIAVALSFLVLATIQPAGGELTERWQDGSSAFTFASEMTTGAETTRFFELKKHSEVNSATLKIRNEIYYMDEGQEYQSTHWPTNPSMDLFNDGTVDWRFPGKMGLQTYFGNETTDADLKWESSGTVKTIDFPIPKSTILGASIQICNTQTSKFGYQLRVGETPVWSKESLSFTMSDTSFCKESVNYVTVGDINGDGINDLVGCGMNGKIYISRSVQGKLMNGTIVDCYVEGNQRDMLMVALGNIDDQAGLDIVASCADGNFYYLLNQGGTGLFGGASKIETGAGGRMASVTIGDIDGDGDFDILGGALNGRFYILLNEMASFDTTPGNPFFKSIPAGSGQMNDVEICDINQDTYLDIVGANSNKQFYVAFNSGSGASFENPFPVVTGAARDMNSIACEDIDGDTDLDLVGASNDGKVYICLNLGNSQGMNAGEFDTQQGHVLKITCESGTNSLRTAVVKDISGDGALDIIALGTSNLGQIYLQLNDGFGNFREENLYKAFSGGQSAKSIQVDFMNKDTNLDIVVANGTRMDVWLNNQGKFTETVSGPGFIMALQNYINSAAATPDEYGNPIVYVPLNMYNRYTGQLHFSNLVMNYSYTMTVDMGPKLWDQLNASSSSQFASDPLKFAVLFKIESAGKLNISELRIDTEMGLVALVDYPVENGTVYKGSPLELQGRSNYDPDGSLYNYTWTDKDSGAFLGYGSKRTWTPTQVANYTLRLRVFDALNQREAFTNVKFKCEERPYAYIQVRSVRPDDTNPKENTMVLIKVTVSNSGRLNATDVGIKVYLDNTKGNAVASGTIPRVDIGGRTASTEIYWQAVKPGDHKLLVEVVTTQDIRTTTRPAEAAISVQGGLGTGPILLIAFGIVILMIIVGVIAFVIKKKRDKAEIAKEEEDKKKAEAQKIGPSQADYVTLYGTAPPAGTQPGQTSYPTAPYSGATSSAVAGYGYDSYGSQSGATQYGSGTDTAYGAGPAKDFKCPKCAKPTEEEGLVCLECNARESIEAAKKSIQDAKENALEVDVAEDLLKTAEASFAAKNFADAVENATEADDEAKRAKERLEKAFAFASGQEKAVETAVIAPKKKPEIKPTTSKCPGCGKDVQSNWKVCPSCHVKLEKDSKCPKCHKELDPKWKVCPFCQAKI